jgi:phenylalanine-4-hydroxylase
MQSNKPTTSTPSSQGSSLWLKLLIGLAIIGSAAAIYASYFSTRGVTETAEAQLSALRGKDIAKAYMDFTSKEFQNDTSLEGFREFVKTFPVLSDNRTVRFYDQSIDNDKATLKGNLIGNDETSIPVIFKLVKENGEWKIQAIQLQESGALRFTLDQEQIALADEQVKKANSDSPTDLTSELSGPVKAQLEALKNSDISKAYNGYVSKEFKEATNFEAFKDFVKTNPILVNYSSYTLGEGKLTNNYGKITASLVSSSNVTYPVEFTLVKQDDAWKVYGFKILAASNSGKPVPAAEKDTLVNIIQKQLNILKSNDIPKAYNDYVSKEFKDATSLEKFKEFVNAYPELTQFQSIKINDVTEEGDLRLAKVTLTSSKGDSTLEYRLIKENDTWKVWGINISSTPNHPPISSEEKQEVSKVIQEQLAALKEKDFSKAYYPLVSHEFEKATNFEQFEDFIKTYPIFTEHTKSTIVDAVQEGDLKLVRVALEADNNISEVDYRLINEDGKWKIWGVQILTEPSTIKTAPRNKEDLSAVIKAQLEALKANDLSKAYYAYTSKEFQDAATRDVFKKFVDTHPQLIKYKDITLDKVNYDKDMAIVNATLTTENDETSSVEYRLVYEKEKWKIFSIQFTNAPTSTAQTEPLAFAKAVMGHKVDLKGLVTDPTTTFDADNQEITVNLYVDNGTAGTVVEVVLEHVESASTIPPVKATLEKDGDSVVSFIFTPPSQGWPAGSYKLHAASSTGVEKVYTFKVR